MATLVVKVTDASTGNALPYVHVEADGMVLTTGLDGSCSFGVDKGKTYTVKVRNVYYRPFSVSVPITQDTVSVNAQLQKAIMS